MKIFRFRGSATPTTGKKSEIFAAPVSVQLP